MAGFNGLGMNLGTWRDFSPTRSCGRLAENFTGEGAGGMATDGGGAASAAAGRTGVEVFVVIQPEARDRGPKVRAPSSRSG